MTRINVSAAVGLLLVTCAVCTVAQADTIADWDFGTLAVTAPDNTPAATAGVAAGAAATFQPLAGHDQHLHRVERQQRIDHGG